MYTKSSISWLRWYVCFLPFSSARAFSYSRGIIHPFASAAAVVAAAAASFFYLFTNRMQIYTQQQEREREREASVSVTTHKQMHLVYSSISSAFEKHDAHESLHHPKFKLKLFSLGRKYASAFWMLSFFFHWLFF